MLNKAICKQCWKKQWNSTKDKTWSCRLDKPGGFGVYTQYDTNSEIPDNCPYILEHLMQNHQKSSNIFLNPPQEK